MTFDEFAIQVFGSSFPNDAALAEFARSPDIQKAVTFWVLAKCDEANLPLAQSLPSSTPFDEMPARHAAAAVNALVDLVRLKLKAANDPFKGGRF